MIGRVLLVSNRLPVKVRMEQGRVALESSVGGLATGLLRTHREANGVWIGWPGDVSRLDATQRAVLQTRLEADRYAPVHLTATEVLRYYEGLANGVIWPLFHNMPSRMPLESRDWSAYHAANVRFADEIVRAWRPGDIVWIHDYHLLLVPALLRERLPTARIGLFLHIPFPPSETFRILPWREAILDGMLGADLVGFHTFADQQNFLSAVLRVLGLEPEIDRLTVQGREVRAGVFPIGVDFTAFDEGPADPAVASELSGGRRRREALLLGVDRLDYTKGIPRRLLAFERLLERHPRWRGKVRLLQIGVPSREGVAAYREMRRQVDELVGRINGEWSTVGWVPIQILHRAYGNAELRALYRAADVMVVTPLRDGMNLVAKEFVASRRDELGVLVLSEFAGAAAEMQEALVVNPYDIDGVADALDRALSLPREEQGERMRALRARIRARDGRAWASSFGEALAAASPPAACPLLTVEGIDRLAEELASEPSLGVLCDYDGTLVPLAATPGAAAPDGPLLALLASLAARPGVDLHIVSGRDREALERWVGSLPVFLHAEHGAWYREPGGAWEGVSAELGPWRATVLHTMNTFCARIPGTLVEEKEAGVAWHYRRADASSGAAGALELRHHLRAVLANAPVEVLAGNKVLEVRPQGVHKGLAVQRALRRRPDARLVALGDDRTDEDLFLALPPDGLAVAVGDHTADAGCRVSDVAAVRRLLAGIADANATSPSASSAGCAARSLPAG